MRVGSVSQDRAHCCHYSTPLQCCAVVCCCVLERVPHFGFGRVPSENECLRVRLGIRNNAFGLCSFINISRKTIITMNNSICSDACLNF